MSKFFSKYPSAIMILPFSAVLGGRTAEAELSLEKLRVLNANYDKRLNTAIHRLRTKGDAAGIILLEKERAQLKTGKEIAGEPEDSGLHPTLSSLREYYTAVRGQLQFQEDYKQVERLIAKFEAVHSTIKPLLSQNRLQNAARAQEEASLLKKQALQAAKPPPGFQPWPLSFLSFHSEGALVLGLNERQLDGEEATYAWWCRPDIHDHTGHMIFDGNDAVGFDRIFTLRNDRVEIRAGVVLDSSVKIPRAAWTHLAVVFGSGKVALYINGHDCPAISHWK